MTLSGIRIESEEGGKADWVKREIPELPAAYPEARMFGRLPAYGLYCRHAKGLKLSELNFKACAAEERPAIVCDDVKDLSISGLSSSRTAGIQPVIRLSQTARAFIHGCIAPSETNAYLELHGNQTEQIVLMNNNLLNARKIAQPGNDVRESVIKAVGNMAADP